MLIVVVVLIVLLVVLAYLLWPGSYSRCAIAPFWGRNFAHRGLHTQDKSVPENSLAAFAAAAEAGYGIELDVQLSQDGKVVVFHDDMLIRVCGKPGRVDEYPCQELRTFSLCDTQQTLSLIHI